MTSTVAVSLRTIGTTLPAAELSQTPLLVLCHATGFMRQVWNPFIDSLHSIVSGTGKTVRVAALDFSGHGESWQNSGNGSDWTTFCPRDVEQAVRIGLSAVPTTDNSSVSQSLETLEPLDRLKSKGTRVYAVGHSMGGAGVLMAQLKHPGLFSKIIACEPVVFPPFVQSIEDNLLAQNAMIRRDKFSGVPEAREYWRQKSLFRSWHPEAFEGYVQHALRPVFLEETENLQERCSGAMVLRCAREFEADCYRQSNDIWNRLHELSCPLHVILGEESQIFDFVKKNATRDLMYEASQMVPEGTFESIPGGSHFFVMEKPAEVAQSVASQLDLDR